MINHIGANGYSKGFRDGYNKAIDECIKMFDVCTCENCNECTDKEYNKSMCMSDTGITYKNIISKLTQLKE